MDWTVSELVSFTLYGLQIIVFILIFAISVYSLTRIVAVAWYRTKREYKEYDLYSNLDYNNSPIEDDEPISEYNNTDPVDR